MASTRPKKIANQLTKIKAAFEKNGYMFVAVIPLESASYVEAKTPHGVPVVVKVPEVVSPDPAYRPSTTKRIPEELARIASKEASHLTGVAIQHPDTYYIKYGDEELNFSPKSTSTNQFQKVRIIPVVTLEELEHDPLVVAENIDRVTLYLQSEYIGYFHKNELEFQSLVEGLAEPSQDYFDEYDQRVAELIRQLRSTRSQLSLSNNDQGVTQKFISQLENVETITHHSYELSMMNETLKEMIKKFDAMRLALTQMS